MKRSTSLIVLVLVIGAVLVSHIEWVPRDNGSLLLVDGSAIDVKGKVSNLWVRMIRDCRNVQQLGPKDEKYQISALLIATYSPPQSKEVRFSGVWAAGNWVLAEAEFADLLPAVVILDFSQAYPRVVENGVWSGYTKPWASAPFIRSYLRRQIPRLPPQLTDCFEPQSQSFQ